MFWGDRGLFYVPVEFARSSSPRFSLLQSSSPGRVRPVEFALVEFVSVEFAPGLAAGMVAKGYIGSRCGITYTSQLKITLGSLQLSYASVQQKHERKKMGASLATVIS